MACHRYKSKVHRLLSLQSFSPCIPTPMARKVLRHSVFVITCKKSLPHIYHGTPTGLRLITDHRSSSTNQFEPISMNCCCYPIIAPVSLCCNCVKYRLRHKICSEWAVSTNRLIWTNLNTTSLRIVVILLISLVCCIVDG